MGKKAVFPPGCGESKGGEAVKFGVKGLLTILKRGQQAAET